MSDVEQRLADIERWLTELEAALASGEADQLTVARGLTDIVRGVRGLHPAPGERVH